MRFEFQSWEYKITYNFDQWSNCFTNLLQKLSIELPNVTKFWFPVILHYQANISIFFWDYWYISRTFVFIILSNFFQIILVRNLKKIKTFFIKVKTLWEGRKIWKNLPPVLAKQLFLLSSVKTSGRFFKFLWPFRKSWTLNNKLYFLRGISCLFLGGYF